MRRGSEWVGAVLSLHRTHSLLCFSLHILNSIGVLHVTFLPTISWVRL